MQHYIESIESLLKELFDNHIIDNNRRNRILMAIIMLSVKLFVEIQEPKEGKHSSN